MAYLKVSTANTAAQEGRTEFMTTPDPVKSYRFFHPFISLDNYLSRMEKQLEEMHEEANNPNLFSKEKENASIRTILLYQHQEEVVNPFRQSFIVILFANIEGRLYRFCDQIRKDYMLPVSYDDMSGETIGKAQKYLWKMRGIDIEDFQSWKALCNLRLLRNALVHGSYEQESKQSSDRGRLIKAASKTIGLSWDVKGKRVLIEKQYCIDQLSNALFFFNELCKHPKVNWQEWYPTNPKLVQRDYTTPKQPLKPKE